jgi:hypothetical protein
MSLKAALEELGFSKCYHMIELLMNPQQVAYWEAASAEKPVDWDALFEGYQAAVDYPACRYYRELMAQYPEARVILTVRDPGSWYESCSETIFNVGRQVPGQGGGAPELPFPGDPQLFARIFGMIRRDFWDGDFKGATDDRARTIAVFNRHTEAVKAYVPVGKLLVYEVKEGWEPLCRFLDIPVPDGKPFPRLNDRQTFKDRIEQHRLEGREAPR